MLLNKIDQLEGGKVDELTQIMRSLNPLAQVQPCRQTVPDGLFFECCHHITASGPPSIVCLAVVTSLLRCMAQCLPSDRLTSCCHGAQPSAASSFCRPGTGR